MCFISRKKEIQLLKESVAELTKIVKTKELDRLRNNDNEFKKVRDLLSHIRLQVKDVREYVDDNTGAIHVKVKYIIPDIDLIMDDNNEAYRNETFYALNYLNLISLNDMSKIKKVLDKVKQEKI